MTRIYKLTFMVFILIAMIQPAIGQDFLKRLQNRAQRKVEQRVEDKAMETVDKKIDQALDSLENSIESDNKQTKTNSNTENKQDQMNRLMKSFGMSGEPVPIEDSYSFDHLVQMHTETVDKNGKEINNGEFITHLDPDSKSMAYQMISGDMGSPGQGLFIIDAKNGATIILSEEKGKKTGIVYGMGSFFASMGDTYEEADLDETQEAYLANPNVKKTGRSKTIAGYKCDEYVYNDENSESHIWITKDLKMNTTDFFSTLFKTGLYSHGIPWGYMMEATTINNNTGEKSMLQVTKVEENSNTSFSMSDYQITNLGSFQMPEETEEKE